MKSQLLFEYNLDDSGDGDDFHDDLQQPVSNECQSKCDHCRQGRVCHPSMSNHNDKWDDLDHDQP